MILESGEKERLMYPASFDYHSPATIDEVLDLLERHGADAKLMSGGHSLIPLMKMRLAQPRHLIDLSGISGLKGIRIVWESVEIGAFTTHRQVEISEVLRQRQPLLSELASVIADPQVRNRGTIGGSVCHADPGADFPAGMMALGAEMVCMSRSGRRVVKAADWFIGAMESAVSEGEILTSIRVPTKPEGVGYAYVKMPHPSSRFSVVGVAALIGVSAGICTSATIGVTGVGTRAACAAATQTALLGKELTASNIEAAAELAADGISPQGDLVTSVDQKVELCRVYVARAIRRAVDRAAPS